MNLNIPITRNENLRPSKEALNEIKQNYESDLNIIFSQINITCEHKKRDIIVNLMSILDYYIHAVILWGILEITENEFPKGRGYSKFEVSLEFIRHHKNIYEDEVLKDLLNKDIIKQISFKTYQKWDSITTGLKIILPYEILTEIKNLDIEKKKLEQLNKKRNLIVHTFDRNLYKNSERHNFTMDCNDEFNYIKNLINNIHNILVPYEESQPENNERFKILAELGNPNKLEETATGIIHEYYITFEDFEANLEFDNLNDFINFLFSVSSCQNNEIKMKIFYEENKFINAKIERE